MKTFLYLLIGCIFFGLFLMVGISLVKKLGKFLIIYDNPDIPKHSRKTMTRSMIIYLGVLFIFTFASCVLFIYYLIPLWAATVYFTVHYIKLWKYHKRSVLFLIGMSLLTIIVSFVLSPFIKEGISFISASVVRLFWE